MHTFLVGFSLTVQTYNNILFSDIYQRPVIRIRTQPQWFRQFAYRLYFRNHIESQYIGKHDDIGFSFTFDFK